MADQQQGGADPTKNCCNPPPFYGTFPSSSANPPPLSAPRCPSALVPAQQTPPPPYHVVQVGYQSYVYPVVAEGVPVILKREHPLPCCGIGIGWALFLAGLFFAAIPWYVGTFILLFIAIDYREKAGLVACTVAAALAAIAAILGASNNNYIW